MLLLALDTATAATTVALHDGARVLAERTVVDARRHGEALAPLVRLVLADAGAAAAELTAVAVGCGPGPYTGLRVGVVTGAALAHALAVPSYAVGTLDAIALGTGLDSRFVVLTDARRREVFWAEYADARTRRSGPGVDAPPAVAERFPDVPQVGFGATGSECPRAGDVALLAAARTASGAPGERLAPVYLRRPDAAEPGRRKAVLRA